jgi:hypothetical protein
MRADPCAASVVRAVVGVITVHVDLAFIAPIGSLVAEFPGETRITTRHTRSVNARFYTGAEQSVITVSVNLTFIADVSGLVAELPGETRIAARDAVLDCVAGLRAGAEQPIVQAVEIAGRVDTAARYAGVVRTGHQVVAVRGHLAFIAEVRGFVAELAEQTRIAAGGAYAAGTGLHTGAEQAVIAVSIDLTFIAEIRGLVAELAGQTRIAARHAVEDGVAAFHPGAKQPVVGTIEVVRRIDTGHQHAGVVRTADRVVAIGV